MAGPGMCWLRGSSERWCLPMQALAGRPRQAVA